MNVCSWNVRGLNDPHKVRDFHKFLTHNKVTVIGLLETKVKQPNASGIQNKLGNEWRWVDNYSHSPRGRVWVGWKKDYINVTVLKVEEQFIHCDLLSMDHKIHFDCSFVYGLNTVELRGPLWDQLSTINTQHLPWLLTGDFNAVLSTLDRVNGAEVTTHETRDFQQFVDTIGVFEVKSKGSYYSWTKGQARIASRIDRGLGNQLWMDSFALGLLRLM